MSRTTAYAVGQSAPPPLSSVGTRSVSSPDSRSRDTSSNGTLPACSLATASVARSSAVSRATRSQCARSGPFRSDSLAGPDGAVATPMVVVSSRSVAGRGVGALQLVGHVLVAHAPHGDDPVPVSRAELAAQARDVDVHRATVADVVVTPDAGQQLLAGMHLLRVEY